MIGRVSKIKESTEKGTGKGQRGRRRPDNLRFIEDFGLYVNNELKPVIFFYFLFSIKVDI